MPLIWTEFEPNSFGPNMVIVSNKFSLNLCMQTVQQIPLHSIHHSKVTEGIFQNERSS